MVVGHTAIANLTSGLRGNGRVHSASTVIARAHVVCACSSEFAHDSCAEHTLSPGWHCAYETNAAVVDTAPFNCNTTTGRPSSEPYESDALSRSYARRRTAESVHVS